MQENGHMNYRTGPGMLSESQEAELEPIIDTTLTVNHLLYIPAGYFHKAVPAGPRISISVPVIESRREYPIDRRVYDFTKNIT